VRFDQVGGAQGDHAEDALAVWVDDADVEAGKTYRYRMRVQLWNSLVGRRGVVRDVADAGRAVIVGPWSQPSEPVTAAPRTHYFVLGPSVNEEAANVEVWKWHRGRWLRKLFTVAVGEAIGGVRRVTLPERDESGRVIREEVDFDTGVVVLGLSEANVAKRIADEETGRFAWAGASTLMAVCSDAVDGHVEQRFARVDRSSALRQRLREP
jgi:hypothetical protein